jgi:hypothetical protein
LPEWGARYSPPLVNLSMFELMPSSLIAAHFSISEFPEFFAWPRPKAAVHGRTSRK